MADKRSKELRQMKQEALDAEPSLDQMLDLTDPKVLKGLGRMVKKAYQKSLSKKEKH